jgi:hypothetical protein
LTAYCLSRHVAAPLRNADLTDVHAAFSPNEAALLALLESLAAA